MNKDAEMKFRDPISRRRALQWIGGATLMVAAGGTGLLAGRDTGLLAGRRAPPMLRASRPLMGTRATILLGGVREEAGAAIMHRAFGALHEVDQLMSRFRADSDIGRINARPDAWHTVSPQSAFVLDAAMAIARASDGYFDPCMDKLVSLWGFHDHAYPETAPRAAAGTVQGGHFYRGLKDRSARDGGRQFQLAGRSPGSQREIDLGIDLGGIAKGFAIDRAAEQLRADGVKSALVNVGDDIRAVGSHPSGGPWRIGVRHPRRPGALLEVLELRDEAVATSGDYENYFERSGTRYAHVLDPHRGRPARNHRSFTVAAPTAMAADALATAAFAAPPAKAKALLRRLDSGPWLGMDTAGNTYRS